MFSIIDCGSTSTRVYIIGNDNQIISKSSVGVGVKNTAQTGSNEILKEGLKQCFQEAVANVNINLKDIEFAVAFGMITSEIGLMEIPHLTAPVSLEDLVDNTMIVRNTDIFPLDLPIIFIRGLKNNCNAESLESIRGVDLMRGEETQAIGALSLLQPNLPVNILELGSTTKLIHIDEEGRISGSITSISGQVYDAIKKETFIGKCIRNNGDTPEVSGFFSEEILERAKECVSKAGFLRTMLLTRFSEIVLPTEWYERKFFVESAIAADDLKLFDEAEDLLKFNLDTDFILVGNKERCKIYEYIIKQRKGYNNKITFISDKEEIDMLAVKGAVKIAEKARTLITK
jgi:2-dehydro-3-deoxygalactonokinase